MRNFVPAVTHCLRLARWLCKAKLLGQLSHLKEIFIEFGGELWRMPVAPDERLTSLEILVVNREGVVERHILDVVGVTVMYYNRCSVEKLATIARIRMTETEIMSPTEGKEDGEGDGP